MRVLGLDTSLTNTGMTRVDLHPDGPVVPGTVVPHVMYTVAVGSKSGVIKTRHALARRVNALVEQIDEAMVATDLVAIETLAYGGTVKGTNAYALPWIWGRVIELVERRRIPLLVVGTSQIKKYATGNGGTATKKDHVLAAAMKRHPDAGITGFDTADSSMAAAIGCRYLGFPIDKVPQKNLEIMGALEYNEP